MVKARRDASHRELSDATPPLRSSPSAVSPVGMRQKKRFTIRPKKELLQFDPSSALNIRTSVTMLPMITVLSIAAHSRDRRPYGRITWRQLARSASQPR